MGVEEYDPSERTRCPECAEEILVAARRCKHCGARLREAPEEMLLVLHPSWWDNLVLLLFSFLIVPLILALVRTYSLTYTITTRRVMVRRGLLARNVSEVDIRDIRAVSVQQSIGQRIGGVGNVLVDTAASDGVELVLKNVPGPHRVKELIIAQKRHRDDD